MDRIVISDLAVKYRVGVTAAERRKPQRLKLTVQFERDVSKAAARDVLDATIDYYAVTQRLLQFGEKRSWRLIETLAVDIANTLGNEYRASVVTVGVKKFIIREADHVAVWVTRRRRSHSPREA